MIFKVAALFCKGAVCAALLFYTPSSLADDASFASLRYAVENPQGHSALKECPSEQEIRQAVAGRVGYWPWKDNGDRHIEMVISEDGDNLRARMLLTDKAGKLIGRREVKSNETCREIAKAAALAVAIAIAPTAALNGEDVEVLPPVSTAEAAPKSSNEVTETPVVADTSSRSVAEAMVYFGGLGTWGTAPTVTGGLDLGLGVRLGISSIHLGARYDFPSEESVNPGTVSTRSLLGQLAVCLHHTYIFGCAGVSVGAMWAQGDGLHQSQKEVSPAAWTFVRLGIEVPIASFIAIRTYADLSAAIVRHRLLETGTDAVFWETPLLGAVWGGAFVFTFFDGNESSTTIE